MKITLFNSLLTLLLIQTGSELFSKKEIINDGRNIHFVFDEGLNEDPKFQLSKDKNGFYFMILTKEGQNIQRISMRLLDGDNVVYSKCYGRRHGIQWRSNLYWWVLEGETIANITKTYFNPFNEKIKWVNLHPLETWKDEKTPTINQSSITDEYTGRKRIVIAAIEKMSGDLMKISVRYYHGISKWMEDPSFYTSTRNIELIDSVK